MGRNRNKRQIPITLPAGKVIPEKGELDFQVDGCINLIGQNSQQIGEPVTAGALALVHVFAPDAGGIEGVFREFPVPHEPDLIKSRDQLAQVAGLDGMVPRDPVRDILHMPAFHFLAGHLS